MTKSNTDTLKELLFVLLIFFSNTLAVPLIAATVINMIGGLEGENTFMPSFILFTFFFVFVKGIIAGFKDAMEEASNIINK